MNCAALYVLKILSRKWSYLVLRALQQPRHFSELQRSMRFVTNRVLSRELRMLREEGLIEQKDGEYSLTRAGVDLVEAMQSLIEWSARHKELHLCPKEKECGRCASYADAVGVRFRTNA